MTVIPLFVEWFQNQRPRPLPSRAERLLLSPRGLSLRKECVTITIAHVFFRASLPYFEARRPLSFWGNGVCLKQLLSESSLNHHCSEPGCWPLSSAVSLMQPPALCLRSLSATNRRLLCVTEFCSRLGTIEGGSIKVWAFRKCSQDSKKRPGRKWGGGGCLTDTCGLKKRNGHCYIWL